MTWKFTTMTENSLPLPIERTQILIDYLLTCDLEKMPLEVRENFWFYIDHALGYNFWASKQKEIECLLNTKESCPQALTLVR
jgi:hypothetical protein